MKEITQEQFLEQFGHVEVKFSSYYKFTFTFTGHDAETGTYLKMNIGGDAEDIYRLDVDADMVLKVRDGDWCSGVADVPREGEVGFRDFL